MATEISYAHVHPWKSFEQRPSDVASRCSLRLVRLRWKEHPHARRAL